MMNASDAIEIRTYGCTVEQMTEAVDQRLKQFSSPKDYVDRLMSTASSMLESGDDRMVIEDARQQINRARWVMARFV